jgi:hypothetical protein
VLRGLASGAATVGLALVGLLSTAGTAAAAPVRGVSEDAISSPQALVLHGSHGYGITVDAYPGGRGRGARVVVLVEGRRSFLRYTAPASLAGEGIHANLGRFGRIDLRWVPDGRVGEVTLACHGHAPRRTFRFDRGAYVGTLRFRGGGGFTAVRAHRVAWQPSWYRSYDTCRREGGEYTPGPGKILQADIGVHDPTVRFFAYQPRCGAPVDYEAFDRERVGRIGIDRSTWTHGGAPTLSSASDFSTATIEPPAPFSGTASFDRAKGAGGTWTGDLIVKFPDGSVAPMAGSAFTATFYSGGFEGEAR